MKHSSLFIGCFLFLLSAAYIQAQSVANIISEFDGERITITYTLRYSVASQKFKISVYSSHNDFQKPLELVTGDVGDNILPGTRKKVVWDVKNELPPYFDDELSFKIKAIAMAIPNYKITPLLSNNFKRGSELTLNWQGGAPNDNIKIDLLKNNVVQQSITQTNNSYSYKWQIPKKQKPASTYALRISSVNNPSQKATTNFFKIKPKVSLLVKVGIPIVVGVLVGVLLSGDKGSETPTTNNNELSELPGPINPGG